MVTGKAAVHATITPLDGSNYTTWKLQCQMALMKDGLWDIVTGTTVRPAGDEDAQAKFDKMRDKALAIIVLSLIHRYCTWWVSPSILWLSGRY